MTEFLLAAGFLTIGLGVGYGLGRRSIIKHIEPMTKDLMDLADMVAEREQFMQLLRMKDNSLADITEADDAPRGARHSRDCWSHWPFSCELPEGHGPQDDH